MNRALLYVGPVCLGAGIVVLTLDADSVVGYVLVGIFVLFTIGFALRRGLEVIREIGRMS